VRRFGLKAERRTAKRSIVIPTAVSTLGTILCKIMASFSKMGVDGVESSDQTIREFHANETIRRMEN
jgi:hypothetical protein